MTCLRVCFLCSFFVSLSFVLEKLFLVQWHNDPTYGRSYKWISHELTFNKIEIEVNLEAFLG